MLERIKQLKYKKIIIGLIVVFVVVGLGLILIPNEFVQAQTTVTPGDNTTDTLGQWVAQFLTWIITLFISLIGRLLIIFIDLLLWVSKFNQFIDSNAVVIGWVVVRDLANIFFVVIMLTIALGTMFNLQSYEYKKLLPKLMVAVILVNFSKMIVGLTIDVGQVIMLTFVNAFKEVGAAAIVNGLSLQAMFDLKEMVEDVGGDNKIEYWSLFGSACLALVMLLVASVVVLQLVVVLLFRIIMLWVLIIFSPIAFVASVMPTSPLQKVGFFGQYWLYLSKYIIVGPILAFFLWLSFSIMQTINQGSNIHIIDLQRDNTKSNAEYLATKISDPQNMFDYMTTIALLLASLMITQQMGVMGGAMGMNAVNKIKSKAGAMASSWAKNRKEGITGRLDRASIKAQAGLGLDKPKSFRSSARKAAKDAHKQRVDDAVMKKYGVVGAMEDRLNRGVFNWKGDETNKQQLESDRHVIEKQKEIQESSRGKSEEGLASIFKQTSNSSEKEAALYELVKTHGLNQLTGEDEDTSSQAVKKLVIDTFGDGEKGLRVMENLQEMGVNNKDVQLYGTVKTDLKTGERKWAYDGDGSNDVENLKKQAEAAAEMNGRKPGYGQINTITNAAYEVKDGKLTVGAGEMFKTSAIQLGRSYERVGDREQKHFSNNIEAFKNFADEETDSKTKKAMYQAIGRMMNPNGKGAELFRNGEIINKNEVDEIIKQYKETGTTGSASTTSKKEVNHEEEVVKKEKTIEEINEVIRKDKEDQVETAAKGEFNSDEYKQRQEKIEKNEQKVKDLQNEIQSEHRPAAAEQVVDSLNKEDMGNAVEMQQIGDKVAKAVETALKDIGQGIDFTKATQGLDKFTDSLNKEIGKIKDDSKKPDLGFASSDNMNKIDNPTIQLSMLKKLGEIAKKLGKKAGKEE